MPSLLSDLHYKNMIYLKQMQLAIKILNMKEESKFTDTVYPMYLLIFLIFLFTFSGPFFLVCCD